MVSSGDTTSKRFIEACRLFVDTELNSGTLVETSREQANYLLNVLRLRPGGHLLLFNGRDGEWRAEVVAASRKGCSLKAVSISRPQPDSTALWYAFAPLKAARLDYMVQKAVEMGATRLIPVITRRTQVSRLNLDRMRANVIEAAEQCGILTIAEVGDAMKLEAFLSSAGAANLIFCDEEAPIDDPIAAIRTAAPRGPICVLIGPEGGFDDEERRNIRAHSNCTIVSLGPRILRADTAAVAALSLVQAAIGDWRG